MARRSLGKRPRIDFPTREVWFKEPFSTTNPSRIRIGEDDAVVDFLEKIMGKGYLRQWANSKPNIFNVKHKGQLLDHDQKISTISEEIRARAPLIIEVIDDSEFLVKIDSFICFCFIGKKLLDSYMLVPSNKHQPGVIKHIVPEIETFSEFIVLVKSRYKDIPSMR